MKINFLYSVKRRITPNYRPFTYGRHPRPMVNVWQKLNNGKWRSFFDSLRVAIVGMKKIVLSLSNYFSSSSYSFFLLPFHVNVVSTPFCCSKGWEGYTSRPTRKTMRRNRNPVPYLKRSFGWIRSSRAWRRKNEPWSIQSTAHGLTVRVILEILYSNLVDLCGVFFVGVHRFSSRYIIESDVN